MIIYAKSGYVRLAITSHSDRITTTTIYAQNILGHSWNNTSDNITSMMITALVANGLGVGTYIALYRRRA